MSSQLSRLSASRPDSLDHLHEGVMCGESVQQKSANHELACWFQEQSLRAWASSSRVQVRLRMQCFVSSFLLARSVSAYCFVTVYGVVKHAATALFGGYMQIVMTLASIAQQKQPQTGGCYCSGTRTRRRTPPEHAYLSRANRRHSKKTCS